MGRPLSLYEWMMGGLSWISGSRGAVGSESFFTGLDGKLGGLQEQLSRLQVCIYFKDDYSVMPSDAQSTMCSYLIHRLQRGSRSEGGRRYALGSCSLVYPSTCVFWRMLGG